MRKKTKLKKRKIKKKKTRTRKKLCLRDCNELGRIYNMRISCCDDYFY